MPVIATDTLRFSNTVKHEYAPSQAFCREQLTVNEATAKTYAIGAVLGKVTATGKYKLVDPAASDGSQTAVAVVIEDKTVPATTDTKVIAFVRGPAIVSKSALSFAVVPSAPQLAVIYASLAAINILANDAV
jgi:Bacteriophage lambda head decoration protein D